MYHKITDEEFLDKVHGILEKNMSKESDFQIKFEEFFGNSFPMIKQRYKRITKVTLNTKHEEIRIAYAKEKLKDQCCFEVMSDLGYKYESNFSKWFKRLAGVNPSEYQAQIKKGIGGLNW
jgi:methylphosphotriester-DNA--protein-cysteine methyltransferase